MSLTRGIRGPFTTITGERPQRGSNPRPGRLETASSTTELWGPEHSIFDDPLDQVCVHDTMLFPLVGDCRA